MKTAEDTKARPRKTQMSAIKHDDEQDSCPTPPHEVIRHPPLSMGVFTSCKINKITHQFNHAFGNSHIENI